MSPWTTVEPGRATLVRVRGDVLLVDLDVLLVDLLVDSWQPGRPPAPQRRH